MIAGVIGAAIVNDVAEIRAVIRECATYGFGVVRATGVRNTVAEEQEVRV
ncbi:hypothetical protein ACVB8X_28890 [Streptomyces sp. NRAIS4]